MAFKGGFVSPAKLIQQLESDDASLAELDLSDNSSYKMKSLEYTKKIGEALKTNTNCKKLVLKGPEIDDQGVSVIADALSVNKGITTLILEKKQNWIRRRRSYCQWIETKHHPHRIEPLRKQGIR